jgi:hypothetical protein
MSVVEIIGMVEKLQDSFAKQTDKNDVSEDINDIKCKLERFLRSLLMAPVHRRLHMCPASHKYTQEQLDEAWAQQALSLRNSIFAAKH